MIEWQDRHFVLSMTSADTDVLSYRGHVTIGCFCDACTQAVKSNGLIKKDVKAQTATVNKVVISNFAAFQFPTTLSDGCR